MHFSINRDYFINQLNHVARAIPGKAAIPVLTGMKLELKSDRLILTGSDASISIESVIETSQEAAQLQVTTPGSIVLSARLFIDIVRKLPTNQVEIEVQDHYNVEIDELKGKKRTKEIVHPRQVAMYLCRELTDVSFPKIGEAFGKRNHTTIIHAYEKINDELQHNARLKQELSELKQKLGQ